MSFTSRHVWLVGDKAIFSVEGGFRATQGEDLLLFLVVQDVAHPSEGP